MSAIENQNEAAIDKKIDLMIKVITRTDTYLNSANTKSTILLSLAAALIVGLAVNYDKITNLVSVSGDKTVLSFFIGLVIFLLIISVFFSLRSVTPFIGKSSINNTFSFVDISEGYSELEGYNNDFNSAHPKTFLDELLALNYGLSKALVAKYRSQTTAIECIQLSGVVVLFCMFIVFISNY